MPTDDEISRIIREMVSARGAEKTVCPSEVARAIAGRDETEWRTLMKPIRSVAVAMANEGDLTIRRKGRVTDPNDFKGIYRLGAPVAGDEAGAGAGNSASVLPET